ncbi:MAG: AAA domain-containing protein [Methylacidiphilales bacterium]|nr:AAA domain-containing protein [Candidatus Methylacidiphilales bacterium]
MASNTNQSSLLYRICQYYLSCINKEDEGISVATSSNRNEEVEYVALPSLEDIFETQRIKSDQANKLLSRIRKDKSRLALSLGYPVILRPQKLKSGTIIHYLEPILLFSVLAENNSITLEDNLPKVNKKIVKLFSNGFSNEYIAEANQLEHELEIPNITSLTELNCLIGKLQSIRSEWPWVDTINALLLRDALSVTELGTKGIYNNAVLVVAERTPFTLGLESELKQLSELSLQDISNTALGEFFNPSTISPVSEVDSDPIIEIAPLSIDQKEAVKKSLTQTLSVVIGPPGTGKSQVVANVLVNNIWKGNKTLFTSKNNKAVDVVEERLANLGCQSLFVRVGAGIYQDNLAKHFLQLLTAPQKDNTTNQYHSYLQTIKTLSSMISDIHAKEQELIMHRNIVDTLDQEIKSIHTLLTAEEIDFCRNSNLSEIHTALDAFNCSLQEGVKANNNLLVRLFWILLRKNKFNNIHATFDSLKTKWSPPLEQPVLPYNDATLAPWFDCYDTIQNKYNEYLTYNKYIHALKILQRSKQLSELAKELISIKHDYNKYSLLLWQDWVSQQIATIQNSHRKKLNNYSTLLEIVISNKEKFLAKEIQSQYNKLTQELSHAVPCWIVTSLSVKNRIPFEPNYFDLVVIDESGQCDIASILPLLYRAKRAVIIGDDKQLRHISGIDHWIDQKLLINYALEENNIGWSYTYNSLFSLAMTYCQPNNVTELREHYRSHASIIEFSNKHYYQNKLLIATNYTKLVTPKMYTSGIRWVNIEGSVIRPPTGSAYNEAEAKALVKDLQIVLLEDNYVGSIGVVTPFRAQANYIRTLIMQNHLLNSKINANNLIIDAIHSFQGDERDIIYFSPVLSTGMQKGAINFLKQNSNLFNVAITRARAHLVVVGDKNACANSQVPHLASFVEYFSTLENNPQSRNLTTDDCTNIYPQVSNPNQVSEWEKKLYSEMYRAGIHTIPQYQIDKYILDFALLYGDRKLNIEVDGEYYHRNWDGEICRRDQLRNNRMIELGWDILRFWVYEIRDDMQQCIERINTWKNSKST